MSTLQPHISSGVFLVNTLNWCLVTQMGLSVVTNRGMWIKDIILSPLFWMAISLVAAGYAEVGAQFAPFLKQTGLVAAGLSALLLHPPGGPPVKLSVVRVFGTTGWVN
jgi:hypothetical protein